MDSFLQGLTMGLAYVAPIGMQNLFVINQALTQNRVMSWVTTLFVTFFDISLACACYFGIGLLMERVVWLKCLVTLAGGILVFIIGWKLVKERPSFVAKQAPMPLNRIVAMAFAVAWMNPQAILDGTMMLGAFSASLLPGEGLWFLGGVCLASCLWFSSITLAVRLGYSFLTPSILIAVNRICALVIMGYAIKLVWSGAVMTWHWWGAC